MNIFFIVIVAVVILVVAVMMYARKNGTGQNDVDVTKPKPSKKIGGESRPIESLSTNDAREWLDDFLVKQQADKKEDE